MSSGGSNQPAADVLERVRSALGRRERLNMAPTPPEIPQHIVRLVQSDVGLSDLFARRAEENKMHVTAVGGSDLVAKLSGYLRAEGCKRIALPKSDFLERLNVISGLRSAGFDVRTWPQMTLDEAYDYDAGVSDVYAAVAETGSLVVRGSADHGRALSLVPAVYVAIVEATNLVADLVDLFDKMGRDGGGGATIISGPSKTADIEMELVVGVHGPGRVQIFMLQ
jgi:L-lactate dehydrogenase complex protein LldG